MDMRAPPTLGFGLNKEECGSATYWCGKKLWLPLWMWLSLYTLLVTTGKILSSWKNENIIKGQFFRRLWTDPVHSRLVEVLKNNYKMCWECDACVLIPALLRSMISSNALTQASHIPPVYKSLIRMLPDQTNIYKQDSFHPWPLSRSRGGSPTISSRLLHNYHLWVRNQSESHNLLCDCQSGNQCTVNEYASQNWVYGPSEWL